MNKDQLKGRVEEISGKVKQVTGHAVGDKELEARGTLEKADGKVRKTFGDAKDEIKKGRAKP